MVVPVTESELKGVDAPTAPVSVLTFAPASVKFCAPLIVELKIVPPVFVITEGPVRFTGVGNVVEPARVILAPIETEAELVNNMPVGGADPPTAPPNEITPPVPARKTRSLAPLIVVVDPEKVMLAPAVAPLFVVSNVVVPEVVTGPVIVITPPLVRGFPFTLIAVGAV